MSNALTTAMATCKASASFFFGSAPSVHQNNAARHTNIYQTSGGVEWPQLFFINKGSVIVLVVMRRAAVSNPSAGTTH